MARSSTVKIPILMSIALLSACSTIRTQTPQGATIDMSEADFASYLEHVFRHHNRVVDSLMFTMANTESTQTGNRIRLPQAEANMAHACLPLNELVSESSAGNTPGFWSRMRLADAVPACEAATRKVEELIQADTNRQPVAP